MQALIASNDDMRSELAKLNSTVQRLVHDNKELQAGQKISLNKFSLINSPVHNVLVTGGDLKMDEVASRGKVPPIVVSKGSPKFYRPNVYI